MGANKSRPKCGGKFQIAGHIAFRIPVSGRPNRDARRGGIAGDGAMRARRPDLPLHAARSAFHLTRHQLPATRDFLRPRLEDKRRLRRLGTRHCREDLAQRKPQALAARGRAQPHAQAYGLRQFVFPSRIHRK